MTNIRTARQKGKDLENYISEQIEYYKLGNARRSIGSGSGNKEKSDIDTNMMILGVNVGIEAKNHKVPHIKEWWSQTQLLEKTGREPILVYKLAGESMGDAKAVIYLDTLLRLSKRAEEPKTPQNSNSEAKWLITSLINIAKKVLKLYE